VIRYRAIKAFHIASGAMVDVFGGYIRNLDSLGHENQKTAELIRERILQQDD
jgi:hypothetical protein